MTACPYTAKIKTRELMQQDSIDTTRLMVLEESRSESCGVQNLHSY